MGTSKEVTTTQKGDYRLAIISPEDKQLIIRQQAFTKFLNRKPNLKKVKKKPVGKNSDGTNRESLSLPIAEIQLMLDQDFFGLWQTHSFNYRVVANELVGDIILEVFHPVAQCWLKRTGTAAVQIRVKAGAEIIVQNKIPTALEADVPHLETMCVKNAAFTLGEKYGRNLNRKDSSEYSNIPLDGDNSQIHENLKS